MFTTAATRAHQAILRNLESIDYKISPDAWRVLKMGIKRDLQAQVLRPNVPVPPRRQIVKYLAVMTRETGSLGKAVGSLFHDGAWTSSGGSFRLAEEMGFDVVAEAESRLARNGSFRYLEIGGAWAGLKGTETSRPRDVAGLARHFRDALGDRVFLHFTNLTQWHGPLPKGVMEHPFVTAAGLSVVERQSVPRHSVDLIYSQAAAYFETDPKAFMTAAGTLLRDDGLMVFNHQPQFSAQLAACAKEQGMSLVKTHTMGGMNGIVVAFQKKAKDVADALPGLLPANDRRNSEQARAV